MTLAQRASRSVRTGTVAGESATSGRELIVVPAIMQWIAGATRMHAASTALPRWRWCSRMLPQPWEAMEKRYAEEANG